MHWIDIGIMGLYLVGMTLAGSLARGKGDDAEDYFTAGGSLNNWFNTIVVGLSIAGTFFSGISFISYPSVVYSNGILLPIVGLAVCMPVSFLVLRFWFLPRYLAPKWKYPYDVLEARFGPTTRTLAASLYILMRVGWMAAMIYAPTIAIMTMGNLDQRWFWPIVLATGLSNTFYTVISGIRGVIVTEAIQMLVIMLGVGATIAAAWWQLPVSFSTALADLHNSSRLNLLNFSFDPKAGLTVWAVALGVTVGNLCNYIGDQMSLQRYLATGDTKAASRSFLVNVVGVVIVVLLLTTVGLSLFVYYSHCERCDATLEGGSGLSVFRSDALAGWRRGIVARGAFGGDEHPQRNQYPRRSTHARLSRPVPTRINRRATRPVGQGLLARDRISRDGHGGRRLVPRLALRKLANHPRRVRGTAPELHRRRRERLALPRVGDDSGDDGRLARGRRGDVFRRVRAVGCAGLCGAHDRRRARPVALRRT
jgi:Na+/proline symporter